MQRGVRHLIRYSTSTRRAPPRYPRLPPRTSPTPGLKWLRTTEPLETRVHIMAVPRPFRVCNLTLPLLYTKSVFKPHPDAVLNKCRIRGTISTDCLRCLGSILQTNLAIQTWKGKNAFRGPRQLGSGSQLVTQKGRPCLVPQA